MNMQIFSLHTHTIGFDGRNTEEEMVRRAEELGWNKIGFSNHFIVHENIENAPMYEHAKNAGYNIIYSSSFDEAMAKFEPHYKRIDELQGRTGIKILKGMEVDFFASDDWRKGFEEAVAYLKPDYLIGSAHFIEQDGVLYNSHDVKKASLVEQQKLLTRYWQNVRATANSGLFNFLAHIDLIKKVDLGSEDEWIKEEKKTVETIRDAGVMVEINTSAFKRGDEPYPSKRIMQMLADENVKVILSDDAHDVARLGADFDKAFDMAKACGITNFYNDVEKNNLQLFKIIGATQR
jgi:histidinol-phosphatase (PHP family)